MSEDIVEQAAILCSALASNDGMWEHVAWSLGISTDHFDPVIVLARRACEAAIASHGHVLVHARACSMLRNGEIR